MSTSVLTWDGAALIKETRVCIPPFYNLIKFVTEGKKKNSQAYLQDQNQKANKKRTELL